MCGSLLQPDSEAEFICTQCAALLRWLGHLPVAFVIDIFFSLRSLEPRHPGAVLLCSRLKVEPASFPGLTPVHSGCLVPADLGQADSWPDIQAAGNWYALSTFLRRTFSSHGPQNLAGLGVQIWSMPSREWPMLTPEEEVARRSARLGWHACSSPLL